MAKVFNDYDLISIDYKDVERMLEQFDLKTPTWARTLMQAVNRVAIKKIKQESKSRGYSAHHQQVWGDSGYQKNATSYANKDFSGKITMKRNAFYYRFIESGANVSWKNKKGNFYYKPKPFIKPISSDVWKNESSAIMQKKYEQLISKWENSQK